MRRALSVVVFAVAAAAAVLASAGVSVPAHRMPPGTSPGHAMPLTAYRLAFLVEWREDALPLTPAMAALHGALARAGIAVAMEMPRAATQDGAGPVFRASWPGPVQDLGLAVALLVSVVPRLPRPTRRLLAPIATPAIGQAQWSPTLRPAPPRA